MLLDRFIINSDYDSQKIASVVELELIIAEFNLGPHDTRTFETTATIADGQYFENVFIRNPEILGGYTLIAGDPNYRRVGEFTFYYDAYRSDATHYKLEATFVSLSDNQITIPTNHTKARVHLLVASKQ
jgi:hypothetical protein